MSANKLTNGILLKAANKTPVFFFDFDGTLSDLAATSEQAKFKPIAKHVIEELSEKFHVGIVSGRKLDELRRLVGIKGIFYSGNHGVEIEGPKLKFIEPESAKSSAYIISLARKIEKRLGSYRPGINPKKYSVSVHYRTVDPQKVKELLSELDDIISAPFREGKIDVFHGKKVVEIKAPVNWNKGDAIDMIMRKVSKKGTPIFFGDDTTDEFGFRKVNALGGISIFVGSNNRKTSAKYRIGSPVELIGELAEFLFKL